MDENKAKTVLNLLDREVTLEHLRELTDGELWRLQSLLDHWRDLAVTERQNRIL